MYSEPATTVTCARRTSAPWRRCGRNTQDVVAEKLQSLRVTEKLPRKSLTLKKILVNAFATKHVTVTVSLSHQTAGQSPLPDDLQIFRANVVHWSLFVPPSSTKHV